MQHLVKLALAAMVAAGCVTKTVNTGGGGLEDAGVAPALVVERFLRAANGNDLETMSRLFGTANGSILRRDKRADVEQRMFTLASILRHQDYTVQGQSVVPGRTGEAIQVVVRMRLTAERAANVPFTVVRSQRNGWLVEQIGVEQITTRS